jgi:chromosome segregation ATPase
LRLESELDSTKLVVKDLSEMLVNVRAQLDSQTRTVEELTCELTKKESQRKDFKNQAQSVSDLEKEILKYKLERDEIVAKANDKIRRCNEMFQEQKTKISELETQVKQYQISVLSLQQKEKQLEEQNNSLSSLLHSSSQQVPQEIVDTQLKLEASEVQLRNLLKELSDRDLRIKQMEEQLQQTKTPDFPRKITENKSQMEHAQIPENQRNNSNDSIQDVNTKIESQEIHTKQMTNQITELEFLLRQSNSHLAEKNAQIQQLQNLLANAEAKLKESHVQWEKSEEALKETKEILSHHLELSNARYEEFSREVFLAN